MAMAYRLKRAAGEAHRSAGVRLRSSDHEDRVGREGKLWCGSLCEVLGVLITRMRGYKVDIIG
ncbi:hypothetical protein Hanom_Chr13g01205311 [Helianthus anomalus]